MGDERSLSQQIESVERSMVFLRKEHLSMLHGLHLEILSLQKRCTELTSGLKMKPPGRSQIGDRSLSTTSTSLFSQEEGGVSGEATRVKRSHSFTQLQEEEELLEARSLKVENRLAEKECALGELRKELTQKGALVGVLRANLKQKERHFLEELKSRSHCSTVLNTELQKQTEAAAYLSFQLHAARQKLHQQRMQQRQGLLSRANYQGLQYGAEHNSTVSPQMLSGASPSSPVVKPKRKSARASSRVERARECVPIEKVMGPAEPTAMPDPALFLHPRRHRARSRHNAAQRQPPLGMEKEEEEDEEGAGSREGPVEPQDETARLVSSAAAAAAAPPTAETQAD